LLALPWLLVAAGVALATIATPILGLVSLVGLGLALLNLRFGSSHRVVAALGGRRIGVSDEPRLFNVLEGLCIENGIPVPEVRLLDDAAANALLQPLGHGEAVLFCTSGLLSRLDRIALQGVVADELASLKQGDLVTARLVGIALGALASLSESAASLAWKCTDPTRQFRADRAASRMTRFPPGLHSALSSLDGVATMPKGLSPVVARLTAPYWLVPLSLGRPARPRPGELDLELRICALAEL
jgi:Zn-dependent protease with chaperone function